MGGDTESTSATVARLADLRAGELMDAAERYLDGLAKAEMTVVASETKLAAARKALKNRKNFLWLSPDGTAQNPLFTGQNAETRKAQHELACVTDPEVLRLANEIAARHALLRQLQASASACKRLYALTLEVLHTRRAEMYVASGRFQPGNGLPPKVDGRGLVAEAVG